jgi:hypothetical protein
MARQVLTHKVHGTIFARAFDFGLGVPVTYRYARISSTRRRCGPRRPVRKSQRRISAGSTGLPDFSNSEIIAMTTVGTAGCSGARTLVRRSQSAPSDLVATAVHHHQAPPALPRGD